MTQTTDDHLSAEIRNLIIDAVGLHHLKPEDFKSDTSFLQGGLALDSVDILEIVVVNAVMVAFTRSERNPIEIG